MRINSISNINNYNNNFGINKTDNSSIAVNNSSTASTFAHADAIKAKYCPNFGKFKKVGNVLLHDREKDCNVIASLKKEKYGSDYISYKVYVNNQEAGYMDMDCSSAFPEDNDFVLTEPDNIIPEIQHIRTLMGDKYAGIGTALVNAAVKESVKRGKNGCLWLKTERGYAWSLSKYRAKENPLPFYYKLGFKAVNPKEDKFIQNCLENSDYKNLPDSTLLLLTPEAIKQKNKYFSSNFIYG